MTRGFSEVLTSWPSNLMAGGGGRDGGDKVEVSGGVGGAVLVGRTAV